LCCFSILCQGEVAVRVVNFQSLPKGTSSIVPAKEQEVLESAFNTNLLINI